jgi:hypothetical protein
MFKEKIDLFHLYVNVARNRRLTMKETGIMFLKVLISLSKDVIKSFLFYFRKPKRKIPDFQRKKIVFGSSYNNYETLKFLIQKYPNTILVCSGGYAAKQAGAINVRGLLMSHFHFSKYLFLIYLIITGKYRVRHYELIIKEYGFVDSYMKLLKDNKPECIFVANDHYPACRALILAAKKLLVKCIYLQHASVTDVFPPLRNSHALLYGQYSEDIYTSIGSIQSKIIQVGNHKFDPYKECIENKKHTGKIGVAFNTLDNLESVLSLCRYLTEHFNPEQIILRAHPLERRKYEINVDRSFAKTENSIDFLKCIDVLIAGNSSILLEAASMNVYPLQVYFGEIPKEMMDYYGFIKTGVAKEIRDWNQLKPEIITIFNKTQFDCRKRTRLYDASVGEPYELDVQNHIVSVVNKILETERI